MLQAGGEQQGSFFLLMPARSQHLGWSCEQRGRRLPERSGGVRGTRGPGEDRELLVLGTLPV